jgi:hypothetical protein
MSRGGRKSWYHLVIKHQFSVVTFFADLRKIQVTLKPLIMEVLVFTSGLSANAAP